MKSRTYFIYIILLILLTGAAGCTKVNTTSPELIYSRKIEMPGQTEMLVNLISKRYPDQFNALHKVGLNIRGKTIILKGFLKVTPPNGEIHLIAQSDMGGTLFEVHILNGKPDKISAKGFFKTTWLEKSVVKDLKHLYLVPCFNTPAVYSVQAGQMILSDHKGDQTMSQIFTIQDNGGFQLSKYRQFKKKHLEYTIDYGYDQGVDLPGFITVNNKTLNYTLNIEVRYTTPGT